MGYSQVLLPEFDHEMASTRKVLERIPDEKLEWKAHPKSHTLGWNANHVADILNWLVTALTQPEFDMHPPGKDRYPFPNLKSRTEILALFDANAAAARKAIQGVKDEQMSELWSLKQGGQVIFTLPRAAVVRTSVMNHLIHHRSIICVYLRLNDIPVPGMYGPSGDE